VIISHLVAASENDVIGKDNTIPWHLPNDFKYFKNLTWAMPVIMGRKTFESMGKVLPGRFNIVITKQPDWKQEGVITAQSIDEAIEKAKETDCKEAFIIGGGEVFKQSMNITDKIYLTRVHTKIDGDVLYPELDTATWKMTTEDPHETDEKHKYSYTFQTWEKIN
jgi:dihydrofolate reductase